MPKEKKTRKYTATTVPFYSTRGPYGCFSNFSRHPVTIDKVVFQSSEHFYQSKKVRDQVEARHIARASTPTEAKKRGSECKLREDWDQIKEDVMREVLRAKFTQHSDIRGVLIGTGTKRLVEASPTDAYWGEGKDGNGKNRLGELLMELRQELSTEKK